ncbi:pentatricopeptide repeat-containing protein At5g46100 [Impatiens glandulifera]|uniref:pentatricopeptide repeat-containing protein At5g46100 n=1 Tax=Impatiens glandulifera TaxID=253017 RepID=UPI001FB106FA|nr:pentatricopeptide repeat-containing protein At5g46100 [Impatiens glandulifera]
MKWPKEITPSFVGKLIRAEKDLKKAILVFDSATGEYSNGFRHDHTTFGIMISRFVSANQFKAAEDLLKRMKDEKCMITDDLFLSICRGYGRIHKPLEAIRIFQKMKEFDCEPTEKSYTTVLSILVDENQTKMALRFYKYMKQTGIKTNIVSLNVLIKALCKDRGTMEAALQVFNEMPIRGFNPDSYTYGTLINALCKYGNVIEAKKLFKEMDSKGCSPSVVTYTSLINGLSQSDNPNESIELLEEMKSKGIEPNVFTYSAFMDGLCKNGRTSHALKVFEEMRSKNIKPNMVTYSTLLNGLCKEGKLQEAVEILDRMKLQGVKPDAGIYSKIINSFTNVNKFQEAANFLDEMILDGITPNRVTWNLNVKIHNTVLQGLLADGDLDRASRLYLNLRTRGISVEGKSFDSLVSSLCKKGDLHKAMSIIDEMVVDGCVPNELTWKAVVEVISDTSKLQEISEYVN